MKKQEKILCIKKCSNCNKNVEIRHKQRLERKDVFCSQKCYNEFKNKKKIEDIGYFNCICPICNKKFHLKESRLKKSKKHYCSKECHRIAKIEYMKGEGNHQYGLKGNKNASWKSDKKITNYGYIKIRVLDHPFKDCDYFVFEHRLIAEKYLLDEENSIEINGKKYLKPEFTVHHIDENKLNNDIKNLQVMTFKEHCSLHSKKRNIKQVDKYDLENNYIATYNSILEASKLNKVCAQNISAVCKGKKKSCGGYIWKYTKQ